VARTVDDVYRSSDINIFSRWDEGALFVMASQNLGMGLDYGSQYSEVSVDDDDDFSFISTQQFFRPEITYSYKRMSFSSGVYARNSSDLPVFLDFKAQWGVFRWLAVGSSRWHDYYDQSLVAETTAEDDVFVFDMLMQHQRDWVMFRPLLPFEVVIFRQLSDISTPYDSLESVIMTRADSQKDELSFRYLGEGYSVSGYLAQIEWHPYASVYDQSSERLGWMEIQYARNAKGVSFRRELDARFWEFRYDFMSQVLFDGTMTLRSEENGFGSLLGKYYTLSHMSLRSNHFGVTLGNPKRWRFGLRYSRHDFSGEYTDADRLFFILNKKSVPLDVRRMDLIYVSFEKQIAVTSSSAFVWGVSQYIPTMVQRRDLGSDSSGPEEVSSGASGPSDSAWGGTRLTARFNVKF
jgi:hypothetical protein